MPEKKSVVIHWFRRDLRLADNAALFHALSQHEQVLPLFIFDSNILDALENKKDARVSFIHRVLQKMHAELLQQGSGILIRYGTPEDVFTALLQEFSVAAVYTNRDYEPYAIERDAAIGDLLRTRQIPLHTFKDHVILEPHEVLKADGTPYTVYTPYSKAWKNVYSEDDTKPFHSEKWTARFLKYTAEKFPTLNDIGFKPTDIPLPDVFVDEHIIKQYHLTRDIPSIAGTTRISVHLRFGTLSIRKYMRIALQWNEKYANELIWREFYQMILWHFPHVVGNAFRRAYDQIRWRNNEKEFALWCAGKTGFPLVDAGIRELLATGYMHNRVRMVVAGFLTKDLLIDWRWGEAFFAEHLLDFELASNNGGWQWAAGTGVDAAPYFRIFNPAEQAKKFDPEGKYIRKWIPEFDTLDYPQPMLDHSFARKRCLETYAAIKQ
ncbi:MAG: deoxyribodipyrimidine photo-lyase [Chitinophagales bacterium]